MDGIVDGEEGIVYKEEGIVLYIGVGIYLSTVYVR